MVKLPKRCPICGRKMEEGYLFTGFRLRWSKDKPSFWRRKGYIQRGVKVIAGHGVLGTSVKASRCPNCEIVIFYYGDYEVDAT